MLEHVIGVIGWVVRKFARDVYIEFRGEEVAYSCEMQSGAVAPIVYVTDDKDPPVLLSADPETPPEQPYQTVHLLAIDDDVRGDADRASWLAAFIGCIIKKAIPPRSLIRPRIVFHGTDSLHNLFGGYQRCVLEKAALAGGALGCVFE